MGAFRASIIDKSTIESRNANAGYVANCEGQIREYNTGYNNRKIIKANCVRD